VRGVRNLDAKDVYDAALENASSRAARLRPERHERRPEGPADRALSSATRRPYVDEGVSWALEGDINDFGIAHMAELLAADPSTRRQRSGATRRSRSTSSSAPATT
jgi:hypothetical protein